MAQGLVSYPGITNPKGCVYTQTLGVHPDRITVFCTPQGTAIPTRGDITLSYGVSTAVLTDCFFDEAYVVMDVSDGHRLALTFLDRRERWTLSDTITGQFNTYRAGTQVTARKKSLRELAEMLLEYMGEVSPDVSALSNAIYPEVRWDDIHPVKALDQLLSEWSFSLALGFGSEPVEVVQLGVGTTLSTSDAMMLSSTIDPKTRPEYIRVRFGESLMQARFKLEAVGLDNDGEWKLLTDLSYKPTSWDAEEPHTLPNVKANESIEDYNLAVNTVYRAFRIKAFADDTLDMPDESGTLLSITQCLPLFNRLLDAEAIQDDGSQIPFRVYGKRQAPYRKGEPAQFVTSEIDDEIFDEFKFDGENGIIISQAPQFFVDGDGKYQPAELYLECSFSVLDPITFYPLRYFLDVSLDPTSEGFRTVVHRDVEKRIVIQYGADHAVSGASDNDAALDSLAALIAASVAEQYVTDGAQVVIYCEPKLGLRCDGAIQQIRHIIDDGTKHAASFSSASLNMEFDRNIMTRDERAAARSGIAGMLSARADVALPRRKDRADD